MTDPDDMDMLAAEYVLGTLDATDRAAADARIAADPAFARAVDGWAHRLGPLHALTRPLAPPPHLRERILAQLGDRQDAQQGSAAGSNVVALQRSRNGWRAAALTLGAAAAALSGILVTGGLTPPQPATYVAVLQKDAASPAFLLTVDTRSRSLTVRPVSAPAQREKSYELWLVHDSLTAPKSLGVLPDTAPLVHASLGGYPEAVVENATYAVSLEPRGGSPTGLPTGPVVFSGKLIEATP